MCAYMHGMYHPHVMSKVILWFGYSRIQLIGVQMTEESLHLQRLSQPPQCSLLHKQKGLRSCGWYPEEGPRATRLLHHARSRWHVSAAVASSANQTWLVFTCSSWSLLINVMTTQAIPRGSSCVYRTFSGQSFNTTHTRSWGTLVPIVEVHL